MNKLLLTTHAPSLFFSETLMLLEPSPAAAELCTAWEQSVEKQEQKVLWPIKIMGENSPGTLPLPNVSYVQGALLALPVFPLSLTTNKCLSIFIHSFHINMEVPAKALTDGHWFDIDWWITSSSFW